MDRNPLKIPDETLALEFGRLLDVFRQVFSNTYPRPEMQRRLEKARADGLSWVDALFYAAEPATAPHPTSQGSRE